MSQYENEADYNHSLDMRAEAEHAEYLHHLELEEKPVVSSDMREAIKEHAKNSCIKYSSLENLFLTIKEIDKQDIKNQLDDLLEDFVDELVRIVSGEGKDQ